MLWTAACKLRNRWAERADLKELVGIVGPNSYDVLADFDWTSTFNGTTGGISTTFSDELADPGSGTGGVTILSINGIPVGVPEPSTLTVVSAGVAAFGLVRRGKQFLGLLGRLT